MNYGKAIIGIAVASLAVTSFAQRMPKNSYLVRPATNMQQLMVQVKGEKAVMDRYTRHFGMTEQEVVDYVGSLKLGRLDRSGVYTVFGVPRNGKIHVNNQALRKGELVWFDSAGQPALLQICGNPMNLGPKRTTMANLISPAPSAPTSDLVAMSTFSTEPVIAAPASVNVVPATPTTPAPRVVEGVTVSRSTNLLPLLVPAAIVAASLDGGGNEPVPEPASMTALGLGAAAYIARRKKVAKKS